MIWYMYIFQRFWISPGYTPTGCIMGNASRSKIKQYRIAPERLATPNSPTLQNQWLHHNHLHLHVVQSEQWSSYHGNSTEQYKWLSSSSVVWWAKEYFEPFPRLQHGNIKEEWNVCWEPEGGYQYSKMFHSEPEGRYHCTKSMVIVPF